MKVPRLGAMAIVRIVIALPVLLSSGLKAFAFGEFQRDLVGSLVIPSEMAPWIAILVIATEAMVGVGMLHGRLWPRAAIVGLGLFVAFAAYSGWRMAASIGAPCSCFGPLFRLSASWMLGIDLAYIGAFSLVLRQRQIELANGLRLDSAHLTGA